LGHHAADMLLTLQTDSNDLGDRVLLPSSVIKEIRTVLQRFIQYQMDREIKSAVFLNQFSALEKAAP